VTFEELLDVGEIWVECAMSLSEKELKVMERLVRSQDKMAKTLLNSVESQIDASKVCS